MAKSKNDLSNLNGRIFVSLLLCQNKRSGCVSSKGDQFFHCFAVIKNGLSARAKRYPFCTNARNKIKCFQFVSSSKKQIIRMNFLFFN